MGGSTSLIPLPFVDDWTLDWVRRRMILEVTRPALQLREPAIRVLLRRGRETSSGCLDLLLRTPLSALIYVLKRLFRKIFFFLAVKESTDRASLVFHEGYLLAAAAGNAELHPRVVESEREAVRQLAYTLAETLDRTDTSPIRLLVAQTLKGSRRLLFAAARRLRRLLPRSPQLDAEPPGWEAAEESVLAEPSRRLARLLEAQWPYFEKLEKSFSVFARRRRVYLGSAGPDSHPAPQRRATGLRID